jgi:hypothetical protein
VLVKIWRAFRGTALWALVVTVAIWVGGLAFQLFPAEEEVTISNEMPSLSPTPAEQMVVAGAVLMTFVVVFAILVAVSLLRSRADR